MKLLALLLLATAPLTAAPLGDPGEPTLGAVAVEAAVAGKTFQIKMAGQGQVVGNPTQLGGAPFTAQGHSTVLGAWTNVGVLSIDPVTNAASGAATFTSAKGDELNAVFTGVFDPATGIAQATFFWATGTGKFFGAKGSADFTVQQDPSGSFTFVAKGSIEVGL